MEVDLQHCRDLINYANKHGGWTLKWDPMFHKTSDVGGRYLASKRGTELRLPMTMGRTHIAAILQAWFDRMGREHTVWDRPRYGQYWGCWVHEGYIYFDVTCGFMYKDCALDFARDNGQQAIYDDVDKQVIPVEAI